MAVFKKIVKMCLFAFDKIIAALIVQLPNRKDGIVKMAFESNSHPVTADLI